MFLSLPDPDPFVRGIYPDPDPALYIQKVISRKTYGSNEHICYVTHHQYTFKTMVSNKSSHGKNKHSNLEQYRYVKSNLVTELIENRAPSVQKQIGRWHVVMILCSWRLRYNHLVKRRIWPIGRLFLERTEWFVEDQGLLRSNDSAPGQIANCLSFSVFLRVAGPAHWRVKMGGGGGRGRVGLRVAESFYHKKSWASINRSILSSRPHIPTVVRKLSDPYRLTRKKLAQVESTNIRSSC
jgi:hypothetical protein